MKPLCVDLFCGLGGWTKGFLAEGYEVVGFDIERHEYAGERYPADLVLQDVLTIHGSQFRDAAVIVASPPCQEYSYMAMPWTRGKQIAAALRGDGDYPEGYKGSRTLAELTCLFDACFRIQREAITAAGHHIPLVVENVKGAQSWVGRAAWSYGSYYLWGDVPALMPIPHRSLKVPGFRFDGTGGSFQTASVAETGIKVPGMSWHPPTDPRHRPGQGFNTLADRATKNDGGSWFNVGSPGQKVVAQNPDGRKTVGLVQQRNGHGHTRHLTNQSEHDAVKVRGDWFGTYEQQKAAGTISPGRLHGKGSKARKAASARIAKIPLALARHIAHTYYPAEAVA